MTGTGLDLNVKLPPETQRALQDLRGLGRLPDALDRVTLAALDLVALGRLALLVFVVLFVLWLLFGQRKGNG